VARHGRASREAPSVAARPARHALRGGGGRRKRRRAGGHTIPEDTERAETDGEPRRSGRGRRRSGRDRKGKSVGATWSASTSSPRHPDRHARGPLARRALRLEVADDTNQIDGNVYRGRVQNVLPGMEAAFVDIGIPKNAVLYRGDVHYDRDDVEGGGDGPAPRIEQVLRPGQVILCQVTKNPIGAKGARLTQEVSLPGRFAVLVPTPRRSGSRSA